MMDVLGILACPVDEERGEILWSFSADVIVLIQPQSQSDTYRKQQNNVTSDLCDDHHYDVVQI